jgi:hypothetical protein
MNRILDWSYARRGKGGGGDEERRWRSQDGADGTTTVAASGGKLAPRAVMTAFKDGG